MYPVPDSTELAPLIGQKIILISCSANQVIFHLDQGDGIVAEADFRYTDAFGNTETIEVPLRVGSVLSLVERTILAIESRDDGRTLVALLREGGKLEFTSDLHYESFHLKIAGKEFHV